MNRALRLALWSLAFAALSLVAAEKTESAPQKNTEPARKFPLRGVITAVHEDRTAIMVKHEAIPGVMRAMTMLFRVEPETLKTVKKDQAITAVMSRQGDDWWLHHVKVVGEKGGKSGN